jgi:parallel beta-helix repeat protein
MDEGKFDANHTVDGPEFEQKDELKDMYSKGGLRDILGVSDTGDSDDNEPASLGPDQQQGTMTSQQMEKAMASLEDEDDVAALHIARKEAEDELKEFDESIEYKKDEDDETEGKDKDTDVKDKGASASETDEKFTTDDDDEKDETKIEEDMVKEFTNWQSTVGMDVSAIEASLSPTEKYGLHFRERIDPFWSVFAIMEERRRLEAAADNDDDVDVEELERMKAEEEQVALEHGDLLGTMPRPDELPRQRHMYLREKARLRASKKRRKLTGENWEERLDALTKLPFWYNVDTGEAIWEKPRILHEIEADEIAYEKKWNAMPLKPLILIMTYLVPFPERTTCARVCSQWRDAATDISFVLHVLPVELGATHSSLKLPNHFATIAKAMEVAQAGDMIELADGHYWVNEPGLEVTVPLKFVGDENDPSHVIIELSGCIQWAAKGGFIEGIMFRRPKISAGELHNDVLSVAQSCNLDIVHSILDNQGSNGSVVKISGGKCNFFDVAIKGSKSGSGIYADNKATIFLDRCQVEGNKGAGIRCTDSSSIKIVNCHIEENSGVGLLLQVNSKGEVIKSRFAYNGGILEKESGSSCVPCSGNVALVRKPMKSIPGFRIIRESPEERAKS